MAAGLGFEPRLDGPEPSVLPLDDPANYINSLVDEEVKISINKKLTLKEEKDWLQDTLKK